MANYKTCKQCGQELLNDDMAIYRKLVLRSADEFLCRDCLSAFFEIKREDIDALIAYYKESGTCTLFTK